MTKKLIVLLLAIAPMVAIAQNNTVAYVNAAEIFSLMPELPGIEEQLTKKQESITKDGEALIAEYNKKAEEFQKTFDTASEATKADQQKQLEQIGERYQMFQQNSGREMQELQQKLLAPIQEKISKAIKEVGDEKGYAYIFDISTQQSPIVYINDASVNATAFVKTKLGI
ncbi:MAG: OmpH family outer membrane protein [Proteiniphilum sp.]|nr:OmpH family outer membrane protein [Proteiniphilum sp.]